MKKLLFLSIILFLSTVTLAQPAPPMNVFGNVTEDGEAVDNVKVELIHDSNVLEYQNTSESGFYDLYVPYSDTYESENIEIHVKGENSGETVTFESGESKRKDIEGEYKPPYISEVDAINVGNTTATISWSTDESATSKVFYGKTKSVKNSKAEDQSSLVKDHAIELTGLSKTTTYYYKVQSKDSAGNKAVDDDGGDMFSFETGGESSEQEGKGGGKKKKSENKTEKDENTETEKKKESHEVQISGGQAQKELQLKKGIDIEIKLKGGSVIESISFSPTEDVADAEVTVKTFSSRPEEVSKASENVYEYQDIEFGKAEGKIENISIHYRVSKEWLKNRSAVKEDVLMKRFHAGEWNNLETKYKNSQENYHVFESRTPGFSYFAVALKPLDYREKNLTFRNISVGPKSGWKPLNITVSTVLVNNGTFDSYKWFNVSLSGESVVSKKVSVNANSKKSLSESFMVNETGNLNLSVAGNSFNIEVSEKPGPMIFLAGFLGILLILSLVVGYLQFTGRIDIEDLLLKYVGDEEERITVEDGKFEVVGSDNEDDLKGYVEINIDLQRDEPTVQEKRVYRNVEENLDYDWEDEIEDDVLELEDELASRVKQFVYEVKKQRSDGFVCPVCFDEFDTEEAMHIHESLEHEIECNVCGESFETVRGLHIHQGMTHEDITHGLYDL